jgi:hypothetical protein
MALTPAGFVKRWSLSCYVSVENIETLSMYQLKMTDTLTDRHEEWESQRLAKRERWIQICQQRERESERERQTDRQTGRQRETDRPTGSDKGRHGEIDRQTDRHTDRQIETKTGRHIGGQTERKRDK